MSKQSLNLRARFISALKNRVFSRPWIKQKEAAEWKQQLQALGAAFVTGEKTIVTSSEGLPQCTWVVIKQAQGDLFCLVAKNTDAKAYHTAWISEEECLRHVKTMRNMEEWTMYDVGESE